MKKAKCPVFIFLVIFGYFDSQRICINQNQNQSVGVTQRGQMTTSKRLYRFMLECTYMQRKD